MHYQIYKQPLNGCFLSIIVGGAILLQQAKINSVVKMIAQMLINNEITQKELYDCLEIIELHKIKHNIVSWKEVKPYVKADDKDNKKNEEVQRQAE